MFWLAATGCLLSAASSGWGQCFFWHGCFYAGRMCGHKIEICSCQEGWHRPALSLFAKVFLVFSCKLPKSAYLQSFLLTHCDFCGNLSQQFNITYLLRVPARLPKEPEQVFNFLSLHNEPEPRPSRKGWSGSGCCVAIFYCQIQHRTLTTA